MANYNKSFAGQNNCSDISMLSLQQQIPSKSFSYSYKEVEHSQPIRKYKVSIVNKKQQHTSNEQARKNQN